MTLVDVRGELPQWGELFEVLALQGGYNSTVVVLGTTCLGLAAGIIGTFLLLRKRSLMGDALAHSTLPGLCLAFIISMALTGQGKSLEVLLLGAGASGVLGVLAVQLLVSQTRLTEDAAIGAVLSVFFGIGVVLLSVIQSMGTGDEGGLHHFIYGQTAALGSRDAAIMGWTALLAVAAALLLIKEIRLVCFDEQFAAVQGWPVSRIDFLLMALVVIVTVIGLQAVGLILIIALLIVPPCAARFWTERMRTMTFLSGVFGAISCYLGAALSALLPRMPAGSVIVLSAGLVFVVSFLFAPSRGVIAGLARMIKLRLSVAREHVLRGIYETLEARQTEPAMERFAVDSLRVLRGLTAVSRRFLLWRLAAGGLIAFDRGNRLFALTAKGLAEAQRLTYRHRLWEEYLLSYGHLASSHVDYSADIAEHVLSRELVAKLEETLRKRGRAPADLSQLRSAHPLSGAEEQSQ